MSLLFFIFNFFCFLESRLQHIEVPRLGVESELQLPTYATAAAMSDPSHFCDLHHTSRQHQILYPLSKARYWTCSLMVPGQIWFHCTTMETLSIWLLKCRLCMFLPSTLSVEINPNSWIWIIKLFMIWSSPTSLTQFVTVPHAVDVCHFLGLSRIQTLFLCLGNSTVSC